MKKVLFLVAICACSSVFAQNGGLKAWWVGSDYTNTDSSVPAGWTSRVGDYTAVGTLNPSHGGTAYPISDGAGNVVFVRTGNDTANGGGYFASTNNPGAGMSDFSILVSFTPSKLGCGSATSLQFYKDSGLVGAERGGVVFDWGLGYDSIGHVVAGYGNSSGLDVTLDSSGTVAVGESAYAGMVVSGTNLNVYRNWVSEGYRAIANNARLNDSPMLIGRMGADGGYYDGAISEVRFFNHGLTGTELAVQRESMEGTVAAYTWGGGNGSLTDANWSIQGATDKGNLVADTNAFIESGTVAISNGTALKTLTVGNGLATGAATITGSKSDLSNIGKIILIAGGKVTYGAIIDTKNFYLCGGDYTGANALAATDMAEFHLESGTFTTSGGFNVGGYDGSGSGKLIMTGGTLTGTSGYFCVGNRSTSTDSSVEQSGGTANLGWLTIGHKTTGKYTLSGGTLNISYMTLGEGTNGSTVGNGTFIQTGGTLKSAGNIAVSTPTTGLYQMKGGTMTAGSVIIGAQGTFEFSGGTVNAPFTVNSGGNLNFSAGTLTGNVNVNDGGNVNYSAGNLAGNVNVNTGGTFKIVGIPFTYGSDATLRTITINGGTLTSPDQQRDVYVGNAGQGAITLNSGTLSNIRDFNFGHSAGGTGTFTQNGGRVDIGSVNVGRSGTGFATISNGSFQSSWYISIADQSDSNGTMNVAGGKLTGINLSVGNRGTGKFEQTGGSVAVKRFVVAESAGTGTGEANISSGLLKVENEINVGQTRTGTMTISGDAMVQAATLKNAQNLAMSGGKLIVPSVSGNLNQTGGTIYVGDTFSEGLSWSRCKFNSITEGFPGYTSDGSAGYFAPTQAQYDEFWEKVANTTPQATGVGAIGAGQLPNDSGAANNYYSLTYTGKIDILKNDTYTFSFQADDGGFLYIDGNMVAHMSTMDQNASWSGVATSAGIVLNAGWHDIEYRTYEGWGGNAINYVNMSSSAGTVALLNNTNQGMVLATQTQGYGTMRVAGDYTLAEGATLELDVNLDTGERDLVLVNGDATYDGNLVVNILGDTLRPVEIDLLGLEGTGHVMDIDFANITINSEFAPEVWNLAGLMANGDGFLRTDSSHVPEPATWALMLLGLIVLGVSRRKK